LLYRLGPRRKNIWNGLQELGIILLIALIIFGPTKLPQIGSGLGKAIRDFRKGVSGDDPEDATKEAKKETSKEA
jgi:TatA/E family protein of Tat protein translocase